MAVSISLFAEFGLQGVTMRQIARAADVSLPTIYHHYENKDLLYRAAEAKLFTAHSESLMAALKTVGAPLDRLRAFVRGVLDVLARNPDYHRIMVRGLIEADADNLDFLVETSLQRMTDELRVLLAECRAGASDGLDALFIFASVLGLVTLQPMAALLKRNPFANLPRSEQIDQIVDKVVKAVIA